VRALALSLVFLTGCASLDKATDAMATRKTAVVCQAADLGTTAYALHVGAVEMNFIPIPALFALKLGLMAWIWWGTTDESWALSDKSTRIFVSALGCIPAASNINVIVHQ
jgi:hypothetical protein